MKIDYSKEVEEALSQNHPIVALESTIITHGMPYPENLEMAKKVESIIREKNVVPATIAVIDGRIKVGLNNETLAYLAQKKDVIKLSRRDFGYALSQKKTAGTTVSATIIVANLVGIKVFATGGIGGVHRGASETMDISRDLEELALHPIAVVCAGPKAILDLPKTLEYLETKGVEVIGYQTDDLPAFYSDKSPYKVNYRLDKPDEIAALLESKWSHQINSGVLITNPIPEAYSLNYDRIEKVILKALENMKTNSVQGQETTPYLLNKIKELTDGKSLASNLALVYNNAALAASIAASLCN